MLAPCHVVTAYGVHVGFHVYIAISIDVHPYGLLIMWSALHCCGLHRRFGQPAHFRMLANHHLLYGQMLRVSHGMMQQAGPYEVPQCIANLDYRSRKELPEYLEKAVSLNGEE